MRLHPYHAPIFKLVKKSLRLPIIILIAGLILSALDLIPSLQNNVLGITISYITKDVANALIALSFVLFFYLVIVAISAEYEQVLSATHYRTTSHVLSVIRKGLRIIFAFIAIYTIISIFEIRHQSLDVAHKIISVFFIGSIAWIVLQILSIWEVYFYHKYSSLEQGSDLRSATNSYTKIHQLRNVAVVVIMIISIATALMVFDSVRNIGISILASAGFLTAIVGLAAQKTLGSMFAGIQLAFSQPFGIGDSIIVENEIGTVEELTLSYVVIKIWDARRVILPISYFIEKPFTNLSRDEQGIAGAIKLYVDYTLPIEPVRNELSKILTESSFWNKRVNSLAVSGFKENTVELTIKASSNNSDNLGTLSNEIREKLLEFIRQNYPESFPKFRVNH